MDVEQPAAAGSSTTLHLASVRQVLEQLPSRTGGRNRPGALTIGEVRRSGRKAIVFVSVEAGDGPGRASLPLVVKSYGSDRGANAAAAMRYLEATGFHPPSLHRVPRCWGYSAEHGILVQDAAPGRAWSQALLEESESAEAGARAADWLLALHRVPPPEYPGRPDTSAELAARDVDALLAAFPAAAPALHRLRDVVLAAIERATDEPRVCAHGDYHPTNVHLTSSAVTVIDWDTFGLREPAFDVGYAVGQALIMSVLRSGSTRCGARTAEAFLDTYLGERALRWDRIVGQIARTLLQSLHYELCTFRTGNVVLLDRWPALVERLLAGDGPDVLSRLELP